MGDDRSVDMFDGIANPMDEEAECDLDGRDPMYGCGKRPISGDKVEGAVIPV
jgi:hypothetical protein